MTKRKKEPLNQWAKFSTIAFQMGATIFLGNLLGSWLDEEYEKAFFEPMVTLFAIFLSMFVVIRQVNTLNK
ncbi:hypothetical protein GCM10009117_19330 [Gangjinia marincola]|uniref:ATP synthase protein I n=1 Tax=Gangjinia marincola TaxID=578463 RepID=A0ABN1MIM1_9FLAO